ncbi:MAG: efflux RND transporter permease subunit [Candidatus Hydrogenedentes bacterium]|nr:efflux RND transporter permease subunit [Candidatus Hydrogenedentota bacterium]
MKIVDFAVDRRISIYVMVFILVVTGLYSYITLPRESNPEVIVPVIVVSTRYDGVTPEDMESLVTVPIERKLAGLKGVKQIKSQSLESTSSVVIEFMPDMEIDDALRRVKDKVDQSKQDLPEDADDPVVSEINLSELPILVISLTGNTDLTVLNELADDFEDRIEAIKGVLDVQKIGGIEREIQIEVDPDRVAEYGISAADLIQVTLLENVNTPGGAMDLGEAKFLMRTPGEFRTPDELTGLVVKQGPSGTVYLRDIATVKDGFKESTSISRVNGKPSVTLTVSKRSGENIIRIADEINVVLDEERARLPKGIDVAVTWDESDFIRDMVSDLENSMLSGLVLVIIIIMIFLGFVNAFFIGLAIPLSMFIGFTYFYLSGITLNMVVLFSLTLALGMLVDNGIVVIENIYRHMQQGMDSVTASKRATAEVAWPIIGSTATTMVAFVPMFFWPGIFGDFMVYLPITVVATLAGSLFVGLIVNPALAGQFMRAKALPFEMKEDSRHPIIKTYENFLRLALRWRGVTLTIAFTGLIAISAEFFATAQVQFMPDSEPPQANIDIELPEGSNLAASDDYVKSVERLIEPNVPNMENVMANVGSSGVDLSGAGMAGGGNSTHLSRVTLDFPRLAKAKVLPSTIIDETREAVKGITGAQVRVEEMQMGPPTGPPINIEISGDDYETLAQLASEVQQTIKDMPDLTDIHDDYRKGKPEVRVVIDREKAWKMGLNTQFIGLTVQAAIDGRKAGEYREGDEEYDVIVRFPKTFREDVANIENMRFTNLAGETVPFSAVARIEPGAGLGQINRIDRKRTVTVSAEVQGDRQPPEVLKDVRKKLEGFALPAGYTMAYTGENDDLEETQSFLLRAFVIALLLISLVIVAQFNSILQTLVIMTAVLLSLGGVFLGLWICGMPFGILMTGIGCISLAGVVVNNAIVLLDFINQLRSRGETLEDAVVKAGIVRFRPVMLTAGTTVLGLVPMALGISFDFKSFEWTSGGETAQWWGSMAVAVIFGLTFATVLTLVVVPTIYTYAVNLSEAFAKKPRAISEPVAK